MSGLASPALAGGMTNHAAAPAEYDWAGGYVGLQAGYAWGRSTGSVFTARATSGVSDFHPDGFLGGIHAGYNFEFGNRVVLGAEADFIYAHLPHDTSVFYLPSGQPINANNSARSEMTWNGSVRARAGYAFGRIPPYVTGGFAFSRYEYTPDYASTPPLPGAKRQTGWTVGVGAEQICLFLRNSGRKTGSRSFWNCSMRSPVT